MVKKTVRWFFVCREDNINDQIVSLISCFTCTVPLLFTIVNIENVQYDIRVPIVYWYFTLYAYQVNIIVHSCQINNEKKVFIVKL